MAAATETGPLTFERFWKWVSEHPNCVLRAGAGGGTLFDADDLHWDFFDEEDGATAIVQLLKGKGLVGELFIEKGTIVMVQGSLDVEGAQQGYWMFECLAGSAKVPVAHFLMSHGMEGAPSGHSSLKH